MQNEVDDSLKASANADYGKAGVDADSDPHQSDRDAVLGSIGGREYHNFKGSKLEIFKQISKATGPFCKSFVDLQGNAINLVHFYSHNVDMVNEQTGEVNTCIRVVLVDDKNECYAFVSGGIASDLSRIISTFGIGPWDPPIAVKIVQGRTRKGRNIYQIVPV